MGVLNELPKEDPNIFVCDLGQVILWLHFFEYVGIIDFHSFPKDSNSLIWRLPCHVLANWRPYDLVPVAIGEQRWEKNLHIKIF